MHMAITGEEKIIMKNQDRFRFPPFNNHRVSTGVPVHDMKEEQMSRFKYIAATGHVIDLPDVASDHEATERAVEWAMAHWNAMIGDCITDSRLRVMYKDAGIAATDGICARYSGIHDGGWRTFTRKRVIACIRDEYHDLRGQERIAFENRFKHRWQTVLFHAMPRVYGGPRGRKTGPDPWDYPAPWDYVAVRKGLRWALA